MNFIEVEIFKKNKDSFSKGTNKNRRKYYNKISN